MCEWIRAANTPMLVLANKLDKLKPAEQQPSLNLIRETLELSEDVKLIGFSAEKQINKEDVLSAIRQAAENNGTVQ